MLRLHLPCWDDVLTRLLPVTRLVVLEQQIYDLVYSKHLQDEGMSACTQGTRVPPPRA